MTPVHIALVGNPNAGKTAIFNRLTGARQKVANYAGVTVERKSGRFALPSGKTVEVMDLPGTYSLHAHSADEQITQELLKGQLANERTPDVIVCVVDAANLQLHLRLVLEVRDLGHPVIVVLNMMDSAQRRGIVIDQRLLQQHLKLPVVSAVAVQRGGTDALIAELEATCNLTSMAYASTEKPNGASPTQPRLHARSITPQGALDDAKTRHAEIRALLDAAVLIPPRAFRREDALDRWLLHPVMGLIVLAMTLFLVFQAVYFVGRPATEAIGDLFGMLGAIASTHLPEGPLVNLLEEALLGGLGTLFGFLPQILVLFFFIQVLEASGYLPRAAFLLDRMMRTVGLSGRSFIPLLSSFACAIPGILGTRSIADPRDRLTTMLLAPLMTCSARLPVYALLIAAFVPMRTTLGIFNLQGLVLFALYAAGIAGAIVVGWVTKRIRGLHHDAREVALLMEMPIYRFPSAWDITLGLWERARIFLARLTGLILALTVLMWCLTHYPLPPPNAIGPAIDYSFAGYLGRAAHVIFAPLGFNWQITLALIPAFAARETAVTALATVYAVGNDLQHQTLASMLSESISFASALALMMWFVFAPQCMSTLAVIRRETGGWKWAVISFTYMFALAYVTSFITYSIANHFS